MPGLSASFVDYKFWNSNQVQSLFRKAKQIEETGKFQRPVGESPVRPGATAALLFFEASTRTRMSFETACHRLGLSPLILSGGGTSLEKGESVEDSILNIAAMNPSVMIIRCGGRVDLEHFAQTLPMPIVNAGWGVQGHPTQGLLDAFTLWRQWGELKGKKLLIVGDILHSRVAASHFSLAKIMGYEIAVSGPSEFLGDLPTGVRTFSNFDDGLSWCDAVMMLRFQFERHSAELKFTVQEVTKNFGLHAARLKNVPQNALILHPGPINHGVEMDSQVLQDPRCQVLQQVSNGVCVRQALLQTMMTVGLEGKA